MVSSSRNDSVSNSVCRSQFLVRTIIIKMFEGCLIGVSRVVRECYEVILRVFQGCSKGVLKIFKSVSREFQACF